MLDTSGTLILFIIGSAALLGGLALLIGEVRHEKRCTKRAEATVSAVRELPVQAGLFSYDKSGARRYQPTVIYDVDGKTYTSQGQASDKPYRVGQKLTVIYDPARPGDLGKMTRRALANAVAAAGVVLMLAALLA